MEQLQLHYVDLGVPRVMDLKHELSVGRTEGNDLILNHPSVSRKHAKFELRGDHWWVIDLKSTNGVKVNGNLVTEAQVAAGTYVYNVVGYQKFSVRQYSDWLATVDARKRF